MNWPAVVGSSVGALGVAGWLTYATIEPSCAFWGRVISRGPSDDGRVALTFDDGPTAGTTDRILDELRKADVRATFFVIGVNAEREPGLLRRMHDEGHLVANHSYHHSHYGIMRFTRYWQQEIARCDDVITRTIGQSAAIFRPPMGVKTWHVTLAARRQMHTLVTWSHRAWDGVATTPQRILERFEDIRGGDILLMHDGVEPYAPHHDRTATIQAIEPLVERLRSRHLSPVRLDELLQIPGYRPRAAASPASVAT